MNILLRIVRLTLRHKWRLLGAYACTAGATVAYLFIPRLVGEAIDRLGTSLDGGSYSQNAILVLALLILFASALRGAFAFGQTYLGESLAQHTVYDLRNQFYDHVQHLSFGFHDRQHTGNLMSRAITDVEAIRMFVHAGLVRTPYYVALFVCVAFLVLRLDWRLGLLSTSFMPFVAIFSGIARVHLRRIWLRVQEEMAELSTVLQENLTGVRVVKAFAADQFEQAKFNERNRAVSDDMVRAHRIGALNGASVVLALLIAMGVVLLYGGSRVIDGHLTAGQLAQFFLYLQLLAIPVRQAGTVVSALARATTAGARLFEILDARSPVTERAGAIALPRVKGHVRFEEVSFSYGKAAAALKAVDIEVRPGEVVALLGSPGSGKSTIANLLSRFYDADSGRIAIDGLDIKDVTLRSLRRNIGLVQQDVFLFTASIRDNIAYGREDATLDEVVKAAQIAQLDEHIRSLNDGYDTQLGERGVTLSGGQRQRLSIARAVLLDPPLLVLDDSTSSIDAHTEDLIRRSLASVMRGRTTFVVAHRLSTVHKADQILVMSSGEIAERGTHRELLAKGALYREIYDLQLRPQEDVMLELDAPAVGSRLPA